MSEDSINPNNLPTSWALTTLGSVVNYGSTSKAEPNEIGDSDWVLELEDIEKDSSRLLQKMTFLQRQSKSTKNRFQAGDVLYGKLRPYLNKVLIAGESGYCTTEILPLTAGTHIDNRYLFYWLKHPVFLKYVEAESHGMNMPRLGTETGKAAPFVLAPRNEQTRIANQLDTLLARVQACNDRFDAIPALLKRFRQTVLDAATTGALTQDWRGAQSKTASESNEPGWAKAKALHALPEEWRWAKFSEFLSGFRSGTSAVPGGEPSDYPVLRSSSVRPMEIDFEDVRYLSSLTKVRTDDLLVDGEVLFTRLSGSLNYVANCAVVRGLGDRKIYYPDRLFRARLIRPEQGSYFELCFASPLLRKHLTVEAKSTAGHQRISMGAVTDFPIPMPSDDEQTEIVRRVEALFALADRIEARCTAARAKAQRLSPLVLAKAFRGELVPQDPGDEPASALLARLSAQHGDAATLANARQPRKSRAVTAIKESTTMTKNRQDDDVKGKPYLSDHLRRIGAPATAEALFKVAELPVPDFYKQLAWEVDQGLVKDRKDMLEPRDAA